MKNEKPEVVGGSCNVFRDLGHVNADAEKLNAILATEIIPGPGTLTVRADFGRFHRRIFVRRSSSGSAHH